MKSNLDPVRQNVPDLQTLRAQPTPSSSTGRARPPGLSAIFLQLWAEEEELEIKLHGLGILKNNEEMETFHQQGVSLPMISSFNKMQGEKGKKKQKLSLSDQGNHRDKIRITNLSMFDKL